MINKHGRTFASEAEVRRFEAQQIAQQQESPLTMAAEITGYAQTALERLHELTTYRLPSAAVHRHAAAFDEIRKALTDARNKMAGLTLTLGKEGA